MGMRGARWDPLRHAIRPWQAPSPPHLRDRLPPAPRRPAAGRAAARRGSAPPGADAAV